jgi:hypothetical protein
VLGTTLSTLIYWHIYNVLTYSVEYVLLLPPCLTQEPEQAQDGEIICPQTGSLRKSAAVQTQQSVFRTHALMLDAHVS